MSDIDAVVTEPDLDVEQRLSRLLDKCAAALTPAEAQEVHALIEAARIGYGDKYGVGGDYAYVAGFVGGGITAARLGITAARLGRRGEPAA